MRTLAASAYLSSRTPITTSNSEPTKRVATRTMGADTSVRPENTPTNIAMPPMIGTLPMWALRPPGVSTNRRRWASGRNANMNATVTVKATIIAGMEENSLTFDCLLCQVSPCRPIRLFPGVLRLLNAAILLALTQGQVIPFYDAEYGCSSPHFARY